MVPCLEQGDDDAFRACEARDLHQTHRRRSTCCERLAPSGLLIIELDRNDGTISVDPPDDLALLRSANGTQLLRTQRRAHQFDIGPR